MLGFIADAIHFLILRPIYGKRAYGLAKARWNGMPDFRKDGVV